MYSRDIGGIVNRHRRTLGIGSLAMGLSLVVAGGALAQDASQEPAPTPAPSFASAPGALTLVERHTRSSSRCSRPPRQGRA
jgi:hypothetical protein